MIKDIILAVILSSLQIIAAIKIINYIVGVKETKKRRKAVERQHLIIDIADEIERRIKNE